MSEAGKLRDKALHAVELARAITDRRAAEALRALAAELEQKAKALEAQEE